ncbi:MAG: riboflavin biosynthesis protein RibF [Ruminococcus sp.]|nr:riboflavin biosynthesis protein RibF [Ruminococcus sp.]
MKKTFEKTQSSCEQTAVALGFFDGIHLGHKVVIKTMLNCADENSLKPAVYTFKENPTASFGIQTPYLTTNEERYNIMKEMGVQIIFEDDFSSIKDLSPEDFVKEVLVKRFNARYVFCGFNYHFGKGGVADSDVLKVICSKYNIGVRVVHPVIIGGSPVSSTRIRNLLKDGKIEEANRLLDHRFGYHSIIEEGNHIGRMLETPTINQPLPKGMLLPKYGVYTSIVSVNGESYAGVTNIGVKPTVGEYEPLSETWLPNYSGGDLYGLDIDVRLLFFHREEKRFDNLDELKRAIKADGEIAVENIRKLKA